jgi:hypothetical protein
LLRRRTRDIHVGNVNVDATQELQEKQVTSSRETPRSAGAAQTTENADLVPVLVAWPRLSGPIKAAILAIVDSVAGGGEELS